MSQLGRIGGQVLTDNLLRSGVDLAFETDLLYLDVTNKKISVKQSPPVYDLDVDSNIVTNDLTITSQLTIDNLRMTVPNTITSIVGGIDVFINGGGEIFHDRLTTSSLVFDGNLISSISNSNIVFDPNGSGTVELQATTNITGDLLVTGNINMSGDLTGLGTLTLGDTIYDTVTFNPDFTQSIIPGTDITYDLGTSSPKRWAQVYSPEWRHISDGAWDGSGLNPLEVTISDQLSLDGVNNKISATQSNEDVSINPNTGIVYIERTKWLESTPTFPLIRTLSNPNYYSTPQDDRFGFSIDCTDTYAIIGTNAENVGNIDSGLVYVYNLSSGSVVHSLTPYDAASNIVGYDVAISDNYFAIGSYGLNSVYIYTTVAGTLTYTLTDPGTGTTFGQVLDISNSYTVIGSYDTTVGSNANSGTVYIYKNSNGALLHTIPNPTGSANEKFGFDVALTDEYTIIGGDSLAVYVYDTLTGTLLKTITSVTSNFGNTVDVYGNYCVIGSYINNVVYLYDIVSGNLLFTLTSPDPSPQRFGYSVSITKNYVVVGDSYFNSQFGKSYIFDIRTGSLVTNLTNPNSEVLGNTADEFGSSVAISNYYCLVAAPEEKDSVSVSVGYNFEYGEASNGTGSFNIDASLASGITDITSVEINTIDIRGDFSGADEYINLKLSTSGAYDTYQAANDGAVYENFVWLGGNPTLTGTTFTIDFDVPTTVDQNHLGVPGGYYWQVRVNMTVNGYYTYTSSGTVYVYNSTPVSSNIVNLNNTALTVASTGTGYYKFNNTNSMVIPVGTNLQRRLTPEVGETRWNTDLDYLECFDGTVWVISTGGGAEITRAIMEDLGNVYSLILG